MTADDCTKLALLLQADFDGELDIGSTATLAAHLAGCAACQTTQAELAGLSARLRTELPDRTAPARLRHAIIAAARASLKTENTPPASARAKWMGRANRWIREGAGFGAGAALAATIAVVVLPPGGADLSQSVVASHIRALQPGHLIDVVSADRHTVKPWFDGRLDYAPPVKDFGAQGFPLIGGRLDYLAGRPVAALSYHRGQHVIDLYVWPSATRTSTLIGGGSRNGYNFVRWTQHDMAFWAVSDLNGAELQEFVTLWMSGS